MISFDIMYILAGHSLENDMIALKFVHTRVIDTSVLYPSTRGNRMVKNALRWLVRRYILLSSFVFISSSLFVYVFIYLLIINYRYLQRTIQTDTHNSVEDSIAVMELVKFKLQHPNAGDPVAG